MIKNTFFENVNFEKELSEKMSRVRKSQNSETGEYHKIPTDELMAFLSSFVSPEFMKNSNRISFRKAAIVVVEETLIDLACSRKELELSVIIKKTKVRFKTNLSNRIGLKYSHVEDIHPENPCTYFDTTTEDDTLLQSNRAKKRQYKDALIDILHNKDWLINLKQAELNLSEILSEVKIC